MYSSLEKLLKILYLEAQENRYENRAVVGGLDKFLPSWQTSARAENLPEDTVQLISNIIQNYASDDTNGRSDAVKRLKEIIQSSQKSSAVKTYSQPASRSENSASNSLKPPSSSSENGARPYSRIDQPDQKSPDNQTAGLDAPLTVLPGIGPSNAQLLQLLGLNTLGDLLYYFPRRYDDYSKLKPINRLNYGDELTVIAAIQSIENRISKGGRAITEAVVSDGTGFLRITWFNNPYISKKLKPGDNVVLSGKIDMYLGRLVMNQPEWEYLEKEHLHTNRIVPVYSLTANISQRKLREAISKTVKYWTNRITDFLPESVQRSAGLINLHTALSQIHFPDSQNMLNSARTRLAFDEIFLLQFGLLRQKQNWQSATAAVYPVSDDWFNEIISNLPYKLTNAQQRVLQEVRDNLNSGIPMNRLLQGDVGSGKTIIAALAIAIMANHDVQSALMAPTSILAEQHYRNLTNILSSENGSFPAVLDPDCICLLIGDTSDIEKKRIREGLENGNIKLVVGTHALIEDPVVFKNLQLVIVDEQHRFGVSQRALLRQKGNNPHLLVMTATPIPRSLALTVYGDLDLSIMDEMPTGRQPVETHLLHPLERERAYQIVRSQVEQGHQAFIIYPLIEQGENDNAKAAVEEHRKLQNEVFPRLKLGLLHGRMKPEEKEKVMDQFRRGEYHILVSTSVIEVGVDVPNATVILIESANRFGLAQLHQLRGRVGRGSDQSYCLLIPESENAVENERLNALVSTNDGFVLAEKDLDQRGPGEFLGTRQSGFSELKIASLTDIRLIEKARKQALSLFNLDPNLSDPKHKALEKMMGLFWSGGKGDVS